MTRIAVLAALTMGGSWSAGCAGGGGDADGGNTCNTDLECDDGQECTVDSCRVDNTCRYDTIDERCMTGMVCEVGRGCVSDGTCMTDADCDDGHDCTLDGCGVGGLCNHTALDERCTTAPMTTCDPDMGCIEPPGCDSDAECDDSIACTNDSCRADRTCRNMPLNELCTVVDEVCVPGRGCGVITPCTTATECDDGDFCNGAEVCDAEFGCSAPLTPRSCDDSDSCTIDSCDTTANMCARACNEAEASCASEPICDRGPATCNGDFSLPGTMGSCIAGIVSWDFTNVTFTAVAGGIEVTGWTVNSTGVVPEMADPGPACPSIDASTTLPGTCNETYTIRGDFTDADTFVGTFETTFTGTCLDCISASTPVTGTRR